MWVYFLFLPKDEISHMESRILISDLYGRLSIVKQMPKSYDLLVTHIQRKYNIYKEFKNIISFLSHILIQNNIAVIQHKILLKYLHHRLSNQNRVISLWKWQYYSAILCLYVKQHNISKYCPNLSSVV